MFLRQGKERIIQLDGLRGLAIILVIINHLRLGPLYEAVPAFFHPFLQSITQNGKVGVSLLFMLSGYLMMSLYPVVVSKTNFWQKRYERIFPAFIVMCLTLALVRFFWDTLPTLAVWFVTTSLIGIFGFIWKKSQAVATQKLSRYVFFGFTGLQLVTALLYVFLQITVDPSIYYNIWPEWSQAFIQFIVNATMMLPFGVYIGQLDGVYWSLVTEVFFYLLYPVLFLPFFYQVYKHQKVNHFWSFTLLATLIPFLIGLSVLFQYFLGFHLLIVQMVIYFVAGILISLIKNHSLFTQLISKTRQWPGWLLIAVCLFCILGLPLLREMYYIGFIGESMGWVIPLSFVFILTLSPTETSWSKLLKNPLLLKLGVYSYSLYLTHTISIEMFSKNGDPTSIAEMLVGLIFTLPTMAILSFMLHNLVEKTYFIQKKQASVSAKPPSELKKIITHPPTRTNFGWVTLGLIVFLLTTIWYGFKIPTSLSSITTNHRISELEKITYITQSPITLPFTAEHNQLGLLYLDVRRYTADEVANEAIPTGTNPDFSLLASIKDENGKVLTENSYALEHLSTTAFHAIGLPIQSESAKKNYLLQLQLSDADASQVVAVVNQNTPLRSVYLLDKKEVLKSPKLLFTVLKLKLTQPFTELPARTIAALVLPFIFGMLGLLVTSQVIEKNLTIRKTDFRVVFHFMYTFLRTKNRKKEVRK